MDTTTRDAVRELAALNAYQLANMADCGTPDTLESPGARMLMNVRDAVVEALKDETVDDIREGDIAHELADRAPNIYTYQRWQEFVDLAAWQEDPEELGTGDSDMGAQAGVCLYLIASRLVWTLLDMAEDGSR
jgi:hypothetical protein